MSDLVRIRTENGLETTVSAAFAESVGAIIIDAPAIRPDGRVVPVTRKGGRPLLPTAQVGEQPSKTSGGKRSSAKKTAARSASKPKE